MTTDANAVESTQSAGRGEGQRAPTLLDLTPLNPAYQRNPHVVLDRIRETHPACWDPRSGSLLLTRHHDVRAVVSDLTLWRDPLRAEPGAILQRRLLQRMTPGTPRSHMTSILTLDDPDHGRIRKPLAQALYKRVAGFRPTVEKVVSDRLNRAPTTGSFDLISTFCVPMPIDAIGALLGIDPGRMEEFRSWSEGLIQDLNPFRTPEQTAALEGARAALAEFFGRLMAARRSAPEDDLISDMVRLQAEGVPLSDEEARLNLAALLVGGNLTTTDLIGNTVRQLLLNAQELDALHADPARIDAIVEEGLRYEPPIDITNRILSHDQVVAGCPMRRGQSITVSLRAANHDPDVFEDAHCFKADRPHRPHLAFGGGSHICIGAPLARLEAKVALSQLFERLPTLRLSDPDAAPTWRKLPFFRGLTHLMVEA